MEQWLPQGWTHLISNDSAGRVQTRFHFRWHWDYTTAENTDGDDCWSTSIPHNFYCNTRLKPPRPESASQDPNFLPLPDELFLQDAHYSGLTDGPSFLSFTSTQFMAYQLWTPATVGYPLRLPLLIWHPNRNRIMRVSYGNNLRKNTVIIKEKRSPTLTIFEFILSQDI